MAAVFGYWRTTVPEWKDANARIEALWKQHPGGIDAAGAGTSATTRARPHSQARRLSQAGARPSSRACRRSSTRCRRSAAADAADVRPMAGGPQVADDGPRVRQPDLAGLFRHRAGEHAAKTSGCKAKPRRIRELLDWLAVEFMDAAGA